MAEGNHQGVIAHVAAYQYAEIDDLFACSRKEKRSILSFCYWMKLKIRIILGSIMRTADAVGAHGIIIPKRRAVGLTATVAKASTGAIEYIPVVRVTNMARTIDELKGKGRLDCRNRCKRKRRLPPIRWDYATWTCNWQ